MLTFLPAGFAGLMIASLLAAYVSTMVTHLNWGSSYLVHDLYRRFVRPGASEHHYVRMGRLVTAGLMIAAGAMTYVLGTAREAFQLLLSIGAGTGLLYLLRWFWWRVNAWSEISAMVSSVVIAAAFLAAKKAGSAVPDELALLVTVGATSLVWIAATLLTRPADTATLVKFYELVRPAGKGWAPIAAMARAGTRSDSLPQALLGWVLGCAFVYAALFGAGSFIYGRMPQFVVWLAVFIVSGIGVQRVLRGFWARPPAGSR
jgi:solute:Na+ symporter, SSS family